MSKPEHSRPITLVLDTSAIIEFASSSIHVGEVLTEVHDDEAIAAVPMPCLIEAAHAGADLALLDLLVGHHDTVLLAEDPGSWRALAVLVDLTRNYAVAAAGLISLDNRAPVLTRHPDWYGNVGRGDLTIPIED